MANSEAVTMRGRLFVWPVHPEDLPGLACSQPNIGFAWFGARPMTLP